MKNTDINISIKDENIEMFLRAIDDLKTPQDIEDFRGSKCILKFLRRVQSHKDFDAIRIIVFEHYLSVIEKISNIDIDEQNRYLCLTYDVLVTSSVIERIILDETGEYKSLEYFFSVLEECSKKYPVDFTQASLSNIHYSLGHLVDVAKARFFISSVAIKELPDDIDITNDGMIIDDISIEKLLKLINFTNLLNQVYNLYDRVSFVEYYVTDIEDGDITAYTLKYKDKGMMIARINGFRSRICESSFKTALSAENIEPDYNRIIVEAQKAFRVSKENVDKIRAIVAHISEIYPEETIFLETKEARLIYDFIWTSTLFILFAEYASDSLTDKNVSETHMDNDWFITVLSSIYEISPNEVENILSSILATKANEIMAIYNKLQAISIFSSGVLRHPKALEISLKGCVQLIKSLYDQQHSFLDVSLYRKLYGERFNDIVIRRIEDEGYIIVAKNVKVKHQKKCLTDIDVICFIDGTLLFIQTKCTIKQDTPHDYYKTKKRIDEAVSQSKRSSKFYDKENIAFMNLLSKSGLEYGDIRHLEHYVITNTDVYWGWNNDDDIPVLSIDQFTRSIMRSQNEGLPLSYCVRNPTSNGMLIGESEISFREFNVCGTFILRYEGFY